MRVPLLVGGNPNVLVFYYTGNGSTTFDPFVTTSSGVNVSWKPDDAPETVTSGTTHNFSYTPSAGSHMCVVRVAGGLGLVKAIDCNTDAIASVKNISKCSACTSLAAYLNQPLNLPLSDISGLPFTYLHVGQSSSQALINGTIAQLPRPLVTAILSNITGIGGSVADIPTPCTLFKADNCGSKMQGSIGDIAALGMQTLWLPGCTGVTPGSIAHLTAIRDIRINSMGWNQAGVDLVIASMWAARAAYTYATPSMQIGGTNAAPSGNYIAPEEGADWHEDSPGHWVPLTGKAMIYDLVNDVNEEGFNAWGITYTA